MRKIMALLFIAFDLIALWFLLGPESSATQNLAAVWLVQLAWIPAASLGSYAFKHDLKVNCSWAKWLLVGATANTIWLVTTIALILTLVQPEPSLHLVFFLLLYFIRLLPGAAAFILLSPILWWKAQERRRYTGTLLWGQFCAWICGYFIFGGSSGWPNDFLSAAIALPYWSFSVMLGASLLGLLSSQSPKAD